ncbi:unnamed protein product, partial [Closterium sp. NIES-53]
RTDESQPSISHEQRLPEDLRYSVPRCSVESHVVRLQTLPLFDVNQPLWRVHLLSTCEHIPRSTAVFRIHHVIGDGTSLMWLLSSQSRPSKSETRGDSAIGDGISYGSKEADNSTVIGGAEGNNESASEGDEVESLTGSVVGSESAESSGETEGGHAGAAAAAASAASGAGMVRNYSDTSDRSNVSNGSNGSIRSCGVEMIRNGSDSSSSSSTSSDNSGTSSTSSISSTSKNGSNGSIIEVIGVEMTRNGFDSSSSSSGTCRTSGISGTNNSHRIMIQDLRGQSECIAAAEAAAEAAAAAPVSAASDSPPVRLQVDSLTALVGCNLERAAECVSAPAQGTDVTQPPVPIPVATATAAAANTETADTAPATVTAAKVAAAAAATSAVAAWTNTISYRCSYMVHLATMAWRCIITVWRCTIATIAHLIEFLLTILFLSDHPCPPVRSAMPFSRLRKQDQRMLPRSFAVTAGIEMERVARVRKALGATVNDLMMAVIAAAIESYLQDLRRLETDQVQAGRHNRDSTEQRQNQSGWSSRSGDIRFRAVTMADLRSRTRKGPPQWGNKLGINVISLPISLHPPPLHPTPPPPPLHASPAPLPTAAPAGLPHATSAPLPRGSTSSTAALSSGTNSHVIDIPAEAKTTCGGKEMRRVQRVRAECGQKKVSWEAHLTNLYARLALALLGRKAMAWLFARVAKQTSITVSNITGPKEKLLLYGHVVSELTITTVGQHQAMTCHIESYAGYLNIVVSALGNYVPDAPKMCFHFMEAFRGLERETLCCDGQ